MTEMAQAEKFLKLQTSTKLSLIMTNEIKERFFRLDFYKGDNFILDDMDGVHMFIVNPRDSPEAKILKNGVEEIYSTYKTVFDELNIDFKKYLLS